MSLPTLEIINGAITLGSSWRTYPPGNVVVVAGHPLTETEVATLVRELVQCLHDDDALAIHEILSKGCDAEECPCRMDGVERGYEIPREPLGV